MPPTLSPNPPAAPKWTPQEVIQMFASLDLPVCDDQQAIDRKVAEKRPRYLRDLKSPSPGIHHAAEQWTKNIEILLRQRPEVLRVLYEAFAAHNIAFVQAVAKNARTKLIGLGPSLKNDVRGFALSNFKSDDQLADRFVNDFQRDYNLPDVPDPVSSTQPITHTPAPVATVVRDGRKPIIVKATVAAATVTTAATAIFFGFSGGIPDYTKLNEQVLREHTAPVLAVAFSPDSHTLASGGADDMVFLWNANTGKKEGLLKHDSHVNALAFSKNGKLLATACEDTKVRLWNVESGEEVLPPLRGHRDAATSVVFSPDEDKIVSGGRDGSLRVWVADGGKFKDTVESTVEAHQRGPVALAFSPDGSQLASAGGDRKVVLWDPSSWNRRSTLDKHDDAVLAVAFSHDGKRLASASADTKIVVWNLESGEAQQILRGGREAMTGVVFSPDDAIVIGAGKDGRVRLWDSRTGDAKGDFKNNDSVLGLALSANGRLLAAASVNRTVSLWTP